MILLLDGESLMLEGVLAVAGGLRQVGIAAEARRRMEGSRAAIEKLIDSDAVVYGGHYGSGEARRCSY